MRGSTPARITLTIVALLAITFAAGACKKPRRIVLTKEQKEQIQVHVLRGTPPDMTSTVDANMDNRLRLIGVKLSKTKALPGDTVDVTYYWESLKPMKGDWKVFVHLENATPPKQKRQLLDHHPVGELYPINQWKEGEIIEDVQPVRLDGDWPAGTATLWVGVFDDEAWRERGENTRLGVVNKDSVPTDGDSRIKAVTIEILPKKGEGGDAAKTFVRNYGASKLVEGQTITIDGKLDEPAWRVARPTQPFVQPNGAPVDRRIQARARLVWDDTNLYVAFNVEDDDVWNPLAERDATLWKDDVVEVYLDPGADGKDYVEIQVSPAGTLFDAWFDSHRQPKWEDAAKRFDIAIRSAVTVDGTVNVRDDGTADKGWTVELAIPFAALPGLSGPPKPDDKWTLNLYRLDSKGAGTMNNQGAWAPAGGDFHNLADAGSLTFREAPVARPAGPPVPVPGGMPTLRPGLPGPPRVPTPGAEAKPAEGEKPAPAPAEGGKPAPAPVEGEKPVPAPAPAPGKTPAP